MNMEEKSLGEGRVCSLHLHPEVSGEPMLTVASVEAVEGLGVQGDHRYFGRVARHTGEPSLRHITLIERERIAEHAGALGLKEMPPGKVRSNVETQGIDLVALVGQRVRVGDAVLLISEAREPCAKMDAIHQGLRNLMRNNKQGVVAQVLHSGTIRAGDAVVPLPASA